MTTPPARPPWKRTRIATHILVVTLLLFMVPILITVIHFQESGRLLHTKAVRHLSSIAEHTAHRIENHARQRIREATLMAQIPVLRQAVRGFNAALAEGGVGGAAHRQGVESYRPLLSPFLDTVASYDVHLVSPGGIISFVLAQDAELGADLTGSAYRDTGMGQVYAHAVSNREPAISILTEYATSERFLFSIGVPILAREELLGVLILEEPLQAMLEAALDYRGLGDSGETMIAMRDGDEAVVVTPLRWTQDSASMHRFPLGSSMGAPLAKALAGLGGSGLLQDYRDHTALAAWRHLSTLNLGLLVKMDHDEALGGVFRLVHKEIPLALAASLILLLIAVLVTRGITSPLIAVARAARRMAAGEYDRRIPETGSLETADLAAAFNEMTRQVSRARANLEHNLDEKNLLLAALQESEHRFQTLAQNAPVGIFRVDAQGRRTYVNRKWLELTGLDANAPPDADWTMSIHPDHRGRILNHWNRALAEQGDFDGEFPFLHRGGRTIWVTAQASPEQAEGGLFQGHIGTLTDITEAKRVAALTRDKLEAEAANRAKSAFLATMSHEIRTPLNGILGMTELLRDSPLSDIQRHHADTAYHSGQALLHLINDILDFSKIEAGRLELERTPFALRPLLEGVMAIMAPEARKKNLQTSWRLVQPDETTPLTGDPGRLRQILLNLLSNAVKFTHTGNVDLDVQVSPADGDGFGTVAFRVRDTGIGIQADEQKRLFHPFVQADRSTTRRYGGTGLGLSIVEHLVTLMGGQLGLESAPDQGSLFWVTIPLKHDLKPDAADASPAVEAAPPEPQSEQPVAGLHILVAEDNAINGDVILAMLSGLGCRVTMVDNGRKALLALERERFDLVFMDCNMPVMDGFEATTRFRAMEARLDHGQRLPVVAVTADALAEDRERCLAAGMDDHIAKPFRRDTLARAIRHWIGRERLSNALESPPLSPPSPADNTSALINHKTLRQVFTEIGDGATAIVERFLRGLPGRIEVIRTAMAARNHQALRDAAHQLKGTARTLGAERLGERALELEMLARHEQSLEGPDGLADLEREAAATAAAITAALADMNRPQDP